MAVSIGELEATLRLRDEMSSQLKVAQGHLATAGTALKNVGDMARSAGAALLPLSAAITGAAAAAFHFGSGFEAAMTKVETLSGVSADAVEKMGKQILDLAPATGRGPEELAHGLLIVTSTGLRGAEAMEILTESAKLAAIGLGDTGAIARTITAAITAYGKENLTAADAAAQLFVAVREGGAEADEFAGSIGRVLGVASQMGVSFADLISNVAVFTRLGVNANEAVTALRGEMSFLMHPTQQAREQLDALGMSMEGLRKTVREKGLAQGLIDLVTAARGDQDALGNLIPEVRAMAGIMGVAGKQADEYVKVNKKVKEAHDELDKAFKTTSETMEFKWNAALAEGKVALVKLGLELKPVFEALINFAHEGIGIFNDLSKAWKDIPGPVKTAGEVILGFFAVGGPVLLGLGAVASAVGSLATLFGGLGLSATGAFAAFGPVGLLAGGAAVAIYGLHKTIADLEKAPVQGKPLKALGDAAASAMPTLKELKEMSPLAVQAAADAFKKAHPEFTAAADIFPKITVAADAMGGAIKKITPDVVMMGIEQSKALKNINASMIPLTQSQKDQILKWHELKNSTEDMAKALKLVTDAPIVKFLDDTKAAADRWKDALKDEAKFTAEFSDEFMKWISVPRVLNAIALESENVATGLMFMASAAGVAAAEMEQFDKPTMMEKIGGFITDKMAKPLSAVEEVLGGIQTKWAQMAVVAVRTIQTIGDRLSKGDWVGAIIAGIAAVGGAIGNLFTNKEWEHINDLRDKFLDAKGGLGAFHKELVSTLGPLGDLLTRQLLAAKTDEEWQRAIEKVNKALEENAKKVEAVKAAVMSLGPSVASVMAGSAVPSVLAFGDALKQARESGVGLNEIMATQASLAAANKTELEDLGIIALASFGAAVEAGYSFEEALAMNKEGLSQLAKAFEALGIPIENAALQTILFQSEILDNNPNLMKAVTGLGSAMKALGDIGMLNTDTFAAMERQGVLTYQRIQGEVAKLGGTTKDALLPMQGFLHEAEVRARDLGIPLDENLQIMIDQSKELGIWKEAGKSANDKLLEGLQAIVNKMDDLIKKISDIPRSVDVAINGHWNIPNAPNIPDINVNQDLQGFATGTGGQFLNFGSGTPVMLHGFERVSTPGEDAGGGSSGVIVNVNAQGAFFGTPAARQALANMVSDAVMTQMRQQQRLNRS